MTHALVIIGIFYLFYFSTVWIWYVISFALSMPGILRKFYLTQYNDLIVALDDDPILPITTITPAFNEAHRLKKTVASILNSSYKNIQIIIVNDGSTDSTLKDLIETYHLKPIPPAFKQQIITGQVHTYYQSTTIPNLMVIDKAHSPFANSGADCINAGLNACRTPLYLTVDADTVLEPEAISRLLFTYLTVPHCLAIGGTIYVPDQKNYPPGQLPDTTIPNNLTLGVQVTEYLRSFIYGHESWTQLGGALCHPGAFTLLEKKAVMDVGGYDAYNFSYDAEIIMKLHHYMLDHHFPYTIACAPNAIAWAEQPYRLKQLWKQRNYWQRGLLRCIFLHYKMLFNPKYRLVGMIGFPAYVIYEVAGPIIEGCAYITGMLALCLHQVSYIHTFWLLMLAGGYLLLITLACMLISVITYDKYYRKTDLLKMVYLTLIDLIFYRPFRGICCVFGTLEYFYNRMRGKAL